MSIKEFSAVIQSTIYKEWLKSLGDNLIANNSEGLRSTEQQFRNADIAVRTAEVREMYSNVTNKELSASKARAVLRKIAHAVNEPTRAIRVSNSGAILFESVGIETVLGHTNNIFSQLEGVKEAYDEARRQFIAASIEEINKDQALATQGAREEAIAAATAKAREAEFDAFHHRGHTVSIVTSTAKQLRASLVSADNFIGNQKALLTDVIDRYIQKLEKDDADIASLPTAVKQELHVEYVKTNTSLLVGLEFSIANLPKSGKQASTSTELRKLFLDSSAERLKASSTLGMDLISAKGSPSLLDMIASSIADTIRTGVPQSVTIKGPKTKAATTPRKITKISRAKEIANLRKLKAEIKAAPRVKVPSEAELRAIFEQEASISSLQNLLNTDLVDTVKANMGDGDRRDILNLRSGRFAESVSARRITRSRAGTISVFYTYMKYPYATFSGGGAQQLPRSRDPKLLISRSIRELAGQQAVHRLRSVLI